MFIYVCSRSLFILQNKMIKKASLKDLETILRFQLLLEKYESKFDKSIKINSKVKERFRTNTKKAMKNKNVAYFLVYINKRPVGMAEVYIKNRTGILSSSYVLAGYRGKGIGKALFNARKAWLKSKGIKRLQIKVYKENKNTIRIWNKLGYKVINKNRNCLTMEYRIRKIQ